MAKKIEPRPQDIYAIKVNRAMRHGWQVVGMTKVDGKSYVKLLHIRKNGGYEHYRYFHIGVSTTSGKMIPLLTL